MNIMFCGDRGVCQGIFLSALSICKNIIEPINFYILTASVEARAKRRYDELVEKGESVSFEDVKKEMIQQACMK